MPITNALKKLPTWLQPWPTHLNPGLRWVGALSERPRHFQDENHGGDYHFMVLPNIKSYGNTGHFSTTNVTQATFAVEGCVCRWDYAFAVGECVCRWRMRLPLGHKSSGQTYNLFIFQDTKPLSPY